MTANLSDARRRWLSELYEANSAAVFNVCRRLLNSPEDAADASHEVFLRAAASLSEPPSSPQARAWLTTVARNHCIDLLRRRERFGSALTTLAASADAGGESVGSVEDRQLLLAVLLQLDVRDRQALWQSAVERRPVAEIARSFGLSYMAAAQLLHRARRRASVLATRLAVILGLAQLGRVARRSSLAPRSQQVAAVVVMPLAIAAFVASSSPRAPIAAEASAQAAGLSLGPSTGHHSLGVLPGLGGSTVPLLTAALGNLLGLQTIDTAGVGLVSDIDVDHGKGRDRDDKVRSHAAHGKARGHLE